MKDRKWLVFPRFTGDRRVRSVIRADRAEDYLKLVAAKLADIVHKDGCDMMLDVDQDGDLIVVVWGFETRRAAEDAAWADERMRPVYPRARGIWSPDCGLVWSDIG